ncbi:unnamed protein product [Caenorhabditis nigoni]
MQFNRKRSQQSIKSQDVVTTSSEAKGVGIPKSTSPEFVRAVDRTSSSEPQQSPWNSRCERECIRRRVTEATTRTMIHHPTTTPEDNSSKTTGILSTMREFEKNGMSHNHRGRWMLFL